MITVDNYTNEELIQSRVKWTPYQLSVEFPKSSAHAKRKRAELIHEVLTLQDEPREGNFVTDYVLIDGPISDKMVWVAYLDKYIALCAKRKVVGDGGVNIARAKQVPITNFVEVNSSGFARCPLHNEKTPSMKYYPDQNKWWCFSCNQGGDAIDFVMKIEGLDFIGAVKRLGV